jgi:hypothetical protein
VKQIHLYHIIIEGWQNEGSFGFAKRWLLCRAKTNVPECAVGFLFHFLVFMQQKFLCHSVVWFVFLQ